MAAFDVEAFHEQAVDTPSDEDVTAMREFVVNTLADAGIETTVDAAGNILAERGSGSPHVILNTHIDTVPPHQPYQRTETVPGTDETTPVVRGRGACDAKGPLAAMLAAFIRTQPTEGTITLAITPDEETNQTGAAALRDRMTADAVIVGEPTGLDVCHAARGLFSGTITLTGEAAHAAQPAAGSNAVAAAQPALTALETFDDTHGPGEHDTLGNPTLTPTRIDGGEAINQIPATCTIDFDRRSVPPESATGFQKAFESYLQSLLPADVKGCVTMANETTAFLEAFSTSPEEPVVNALQAATNGTVRPFGAATEASYFATIAPTVIFGPGQLKDAVGPVAHAKREYIRVSELHTAADSLEQTLKTLC